MRTPISTIAAWIDGEIVGDATLTIAAARPLSESPGADDLTVIMEEKYLAAWQASPIKVAIVPKDYQSPTKTLIRVADPLMAFVTVIQKLYVKPVRPAQGIHPTAIVDPTAVLAPDVVLGPHVVVGEGTVIGPRCVLHHGVSIGPHCVLGEAVTLHPHVVLYQGTILHNRVECHANVVLGADGFGYRTQGGKHVKSPQVGYVEIEDDVEIGACSSIDRAAFGRTLIGAGTKLDNHVQIAHNCKIGKHNLICAHVGMAGSVTTGDYVVLAGQVGLADHVTIGAGTLVGAQSGVHGDIPAGQRVLGTPTHPSGLTARIWASYEHLPDLRRNVRRILKHLGLKDE